MQLVRSCDPLEWLGWVLVELVAEGRLTESC
jgi:hypothetical protein